MLTFNKMKQCSRRSDTGEAYDFMRETRDK